MNRTNSKRAETLTLRPIPADPAADSDEARMEAKLRAETSQWQLRRNRRPGQFRK